MNFDEFDLSLETRAGLPEPLRILANTFPSEAWDAHANFGELVRFWLSRHAMFRELTDRLETDVNQVLWSGADVKAFQPRLARLGGFFLQQLHSHHTIEDDHYFPQLIGLEPSLDRGFELLDADHHALDALLTEFQSTANTALQSDSASEREALGAFEKHLKRLKHCLDRHLTDEEEMIVPIILKSGFTG